MSHTTADHRVDTRAGSVDETTRRLLGCGVVAGPLFLAVWAVQAFAREGFDPTRHPASLLALGDLGWIQIANFVITGALFVACAARPASRSAPGARGHLGSDPDRGLRSRLDHRRSLHGRPRRAAFPRVLRRERRS